MGDFFHGGCFVGGFLTNSIFFTPDFSASNFFQKQNQDIFGFGIFLTKPIFLRPAKAFVRGPQYILI